MSSLTASAATRLSLLGLMAVLSSCTPAADAGSGKVPVTTANEEAKTLYMQGRDMADQLKQTEAHDLFVQAVAKDPTFAMANLGVSQFANTNQEFFDHLKAAMDQAANVSDGERYQILILQANADGDRPAGLMYADSLVAKYPEDERAHNQLGNILQARQQFEKAVEQFNKATSIAPNYPPTYNSLGYALRALGKNDEAETAFKKYIELVPNDPNPYDSYGELLMKVGRFNESIIQYEKALAIDPTFASSHLGIAWDMALQGMYEPALAEADKAMATARNEAEKRNVYFSRAATYLVQGNADMAIAETKKGTEVSAAAGDTPAMAADAGIVGDIMLEYGKTDEAMKQYQMQYDMIMGSNVLQSVKDNAAQSLHYDKARVAMHKGDMKTANAEAEAYMAAATAKNNDAQMRAAHLVMGMIAMAEKNHDSALSHLAQASQNDPYVLYQTGMAAEAKGDKAMAMDMFMKASTMNILPTVNYALIQGKAKKMSGM